jgi:hypothetical protein
MGRYPGRSEAEMRDDDQFEKIDFLNPYGSLPFF